jgi:hypothetical protein
MKRIIGGRFPPYARASRKIIEPTTMPSASRPGQVQVNISPIVYRSLNNDKSSIVLYLSGHTDPTLRRSRESNGARLLFFCRAREESLLTGRLSVFRHCGDLLSPAARRSPAGRYFSGTRSTPR